MKFFVLITIFLLIHYGTALDPSICTVNGQLCNGCDELVSCLETPNGFGVNHLGYCAEDQTCLRKACTTARNPLCGEEANLEFICHDVGVFADPFDCHKYHFCVPEGDQIRNYPATCDTGYGYNPNTHFCDVKLVNNVCVDWPIKLCDSIGETDAFTINRSYFYICGDYSELVNVIYPHLYVCPNGGSYDDYLCSAVVRKQYDALIDNK